MEDTKEVDIIEHRKNDEYYTRLRHYQRLIVEMTPKIDNLDYAMNSYYFMKVMCDKCKK